MPSYLLSVKYIVLVVTPLVAIIEAQILELQNLGVKTINLTMMKLTSTMRLKINKVWAIFYCSWYTRDLD